MGGTDAWPGWLSWACCQYVCIDIAQPSAAMPLVTAATARKSSQLQLRVAPAEKAAIRRQARAAGMSVSAWVLLRLLPPKQQILRGLLVDLSRAEQPTLELAALSDFLATLDGDEMSRVLVEPPGVSLPPLLANQVAAMVEHAAYRKGAPVPQWVHDVAPLQEPYFASTLGSLRLHLLTRSPPAFRRRNMFVDATVGDRV
jgi:uncharacterized protein (DUF1778 family)